VLAQRLQHRACRRSVVKVRIAGSGSPGIAGEATDTDASTLSMSVVRSGLATTFQPLVGSVTAGPCTALVVGWGAVLAGGV
jgi:hypothetical protein